MARVFTVGANVDIDMGANPITNVEDPTNDQDAATKKYVDDNAGGSISVTDGSTTVNPATSVDFTSGATVTDGGSGIAEVAVTSSFDLPGTIHAATGKTTPVDNDELALVDSAASNVLKKILWSNVKATLKSYFDTLYLSSGGSSSYLGHATLTSNATTTNASATAVGALTVTVSVPGGTHIKITFSCDFINNNTGQGYCAVTLWDGTVGSGTQIGRVVAQSWGAGQNMSGTLVVIVSPAAGSKTYNIGIDTQGGGGTAQIGAASGRPALLLVESI